VARTCEICGVLKDKSRVGLALCDPCQEFIRDETARHMATEHPSVRVVDKNHMYMLLGRRCINCRALWGYDFIMKGETRCRSCNSDQLSEILSRPSDVNDKSCDKCGIRDQPFWYILQDNDGLIHKILCAKCGGV
jgi:hypothetical protein